MGRVFPMLFVLVGVLASPDAWAHAGGMSRSTIDLSHDGKRIDVMLKLEMGDLMAVLPVDSDSDGTVSEQELNEHLETILDYIRARFEVSIGGAPVTLEAGDFETMIEGEWQGASLLWMAIPFTYRHARRIRDMEIRASLFQEWDSSHRHVAVVNYFGVTERPLIAAGAPYRLALGEAPDTQAPLPAEPGKVGKPTNSADEAGREGPVAPPPVARARRENPGRESSAEAKQRPTPPPRGGAVLAADPPAPKSADEKNAARHSEDAAGIWDAIAGLLGRFFSPALIALPLAGLVLLAGCRTPRAFSMVLGAYLGACVLGGILAPMADPRAPALGYIPGAILLLVSLRSAFLPPEEAPMRRVLPGAMVGLLTGLVFTAVVRPGGSLTSGGVALGASLIIGAGLPALAGGVVPLLAGSDPTALRRSLRPVSILGVLAGIIWLATRLAGVH